MGLFGGGNSRSETNLIQETQTNTLQTDQSGNSGLNLSQTGDVSIATDSRDQSVTVVNALDGGALQTAGDIAAGAFGLASAGLGNAAAANAGALAFGRSALDGVAAANANSLDVLAGLVSGVFDNSKTITRDAIAAGADQVSASIAGFSQLAKQTSESSDDKVGRVAMYAFAAIAAVFVLPALFKGGGKGALA